ncbi:GNAT family N-acetyltransferase [Erwinia sp. S63]|uniref:GNAT family N-acetyltransferase n=1 Tax=Erwinia sp. S63 TaxID=2769341 RepID=UPI00190A9F83|nr:GNAT family N-acetyltransferase [Erwinia sp. S63]MBK0099661.1 GNAT family N-acetyltransferase [Erwinia sp. S63]
MPIITSRLHLRPVINSDGNDLFRIYGDPATNTFNPAGPYPDIDYAHDVLARWLKHWEDYGFGNWAISLKDNPERTIGFGGLNIRSYADITINNLGYRFSTESWGKGLATEFANFAVSYGFNALKLPDISATVRANHLASRKVLTNAGLRYVRDIPDVKNSPASMLFTLTHADWNKQ